MKHELLGQRYKLLERLGTGGMAAVYRATDTRLLRDVAVKILAVDDEGAAGDPADESLFYFHREARAIAALRHTNIVQIYDYSGPREKPTYIVMELVDGGNVDEVLLTRHPLPEPVIVATAFGVASALAHAHEHGVIHRDIKPANVMVETSGRVLLTDFGIAKAYDDPGMLGKTVAGQRTQLFGTPDFMAPEQIMEKAVGPYTDVFALGSLIYCLATNVSPFDHSDTVEVLRRVVDVEFEPLTSQRPDLTPELGNLVSCCLAADPNERPSAAEVVGSLEDLMLARRITSSQRQLQGFLAGASGVSPVIPKRARRSDSSGSTRRATEAAGRPNTAPAPADAWDDAESTVADERTEVVAWDDDLAAAADSDAEAVTQAIDAEDLRAARSSGSVSRPQPTADPDVTVPAAPVQRPATATRDGSRLPYLIWGSAFVVVSIAIGMMLVFLGQPENDVPGFLRHLTASTAAPAPARGQPTASATTGGGRPTPARAAAVPPAPPAPPPPAAASVQAQPTAAATKPSTSAAATPTPVQAAATAVPSAHTPTVRRAKKSGTASAGHPSAAARRHVAHHHSERPRRAAKKSPAPSADAQIATGNIDLIVRPWGTVFVDGQRRGNTPVVHELTLAAGRHTITVQHPTLGRQVRKIVVRGHQTEKLEFNLEH